jgi:predicted nucleic acid-binding protein
MKLVLDSNRLFAALIKDSMSRQILLNQKFDFYSPFEIKDELMKYHDYLLQKSHLILETFNDLMNKLIIRINLCSIQKESTEFKTALSIMEEIDVNDAPFLAVAYYIKADAIWSDDVHFQKQTEFKVVTTPDLVKLLQKEVSDDSQ